jgi:hypothetical protein
MFQLQAQTAQFPQQQEAQQIPLQFGITANQAQFSWQVQSQQLHFLPQSMFQLQVQMAQFPQQQFRSPQFQPLPTMQFIGKCMTVQMCLITAFLQGNDHLARFQGSYTDPRSL